MPYPALSDAKITINCPLFTRVLQGWHWHIGAVGESVGILYIPSANGTHDMIRTRQVNAANWLLTADGMSCYSCAWVHIWGYTILMTQTKTTKLTPQAFKLLECLRNARGLTRSWLKEQPGNLLLPFEDDWLSRSMVAWCMGKGRLTPYDITLLERLADKGLAEVKEIRGLFGVLWIYRAKG